MSKSNNIEDKEYKIINIFKEDSEKSVREIFKECFLREMRKENS